MRDMLNHIHPVRGLSPAATTADNTVQVTQIIDRQGYDALTFLIATGSIPDADATYAVALYEADDAAMATETQVGVGDLVGTGALASFIFSDDDKCFKLGYVGAKRYVRAKITPVNNTGATLLAVIALLGYAFIAPTANPPQ